MGRVVVDPRSRTFRAVRWLHAHVALALAGLLCVYAGSGLVVINKSWLPRGDAREERALPAAPGLTDEETAREQARELAAEHGLRGRLESVTASEDGGWRVRLARPGTTETLELPAEGPGRVVIVRQGPVDTLNRLHQQDRYGGGFRFSAWALAVDVVSVAMVLFALSGAYLWWASRRDGVGWLLLVGSSAYALGSGVFLLLRT